MDYFDVNGDGVVSFRSVASPTFGVCNWFFTPVSPIRPASFWRSAKAGACKGRALTTRRAPLLTPAPSLRAPCLTASNLRPPMPWARTGNCSFWKIPPTAATCHPAASGVCLKTCVSGCPAQRHGTTAGRRVHALSIARACLIVRLSLVLLCRDVEEFFAVPSSRDVDYIAFLRVVERELDTMDRTEYDVARIADHLRRQFAFAVDKGIVTSYAAVFRGFDTNGDGFISRSELLAGLDELRVDVTSQQLRLLFDTYVPRYSTVRLCCDCP